MIETEAASQARRGSRLWRRPASRFLAAPISSQSKLLLSSLNRGEANLSKPNLPAAPFAFGGVAVCAAGNAEPAIFISVLFVIARCWARSALGHRRCSGYSLDEEPSFSIPDHTPIIFALPISAHPSPSPCQGIPNPFATSCGTRKELPSHNLAGVVFHRIRSNSSRTLRGVTLASGWQFIHRSLFGNHQNVVPFQSDNFQLVFPCPIPHARLSPPPIL